MIISFHQRLQCIPLLAGGVAIGTILAVVTQARNGADLLVAALVPLLPFFLAAMTGVAKTTTA